MIYEELRRSILEAAILGNLSTYIIGDVNINEYYDSLIKEDYIKNKDVTNKFINNINLNDNWKYVKLGDIIGIYGGKRIPAGRKLSNNNTGHKYIRVADMGEKTIELDNIMYVPEDIYPLIKNYTISKNDLYITVAGTIGKVGFVPDELDGANLTENANKLVFNNINKEWLFYCLSSPFIKKQIDNFTTKVGQPKLAIKRIANLEIPLPSLDEQGRIVKVINEIFNKLDEIKKIESDLYVLKKEFPINMKKSILNYAFQGKLTTFDNHGENSFDLYNSIKNDISNLIEKKEMKKETCIKKIEKEDIPYKIPDSWLWVRLGEIIKLTSGQDLTSDRYFEKCISNSIPYLTGASNIDGNELIINRFTSTPTSIAVAGNILLTCKGTIGKTCILNEERVHIARQIMAIDSFKLNKKYVVYFLENFINDLKAKAKSMIPGIDRSTVLNLPFPLPPLKEQDEIVEKIEKLLPLCEDIETIIE